MFRYIKEDEERERKIKEIVNSKRNQKCLSSHKIQRTRELTFAIYISLKKEDFYESDIFRPALKLRIVKKTFESSIRNLKIHGYTLQC